jgi:DNA polymerase
VSARREAILREIGLAPLWKLRNADAAVPVVERPAEDASVAAPSVEVAPQARADARREIIARMDWPELGRAVAACRACRLCERRKQAVLGVGDPNPEWLLVGEGPGAEEDERGEPFVGQAGKLLDNMLAAVGMARGRGVYIANTVKCRPPGNRTPEVDEMAACFPYLERQVELLRPRLILALGRPAAQTLLGQEVKIAAARGRLFDYGGIPVVVTYHPAYLLRNLPDKAKAWEDLCFAQATLRERLR